MTVLLLETHLLRGIFVVSSFAWILPRDLKFPWLSSSKHLTKLPIRQ